MKTTVSWHVTPCSSVDIYLHFRMIMKQLVFLKRRYVSNCLPYILGEGIMVTAVNCKPLAVSVQCNPVSTFTR